MPSWCFNILAFEGIAQEIAKMKDMYPATFRFGDLLPLPPDNPWGAAALWGTKWEPRNTYVEDHAAMLYDDKNDDEYYELRFETAWSPPTLWLVEVSRISPLVRVKLEYQNPDMGIRGEVHCLGGNIAYEGEWEITDGGSDNDEESQSAA